MLTEGLHGEQHLLKDGRGYVYWRGSEVEHFSFSDPERERVAAKALATKCRHLASIAVPVNTRTAVWFYSWFEDMHSPAHPYRSVLAQTPVLLVSHSRTNRAVLGAMLQPRSFDDPMRIIRYWDSIGSGLWVDDTIHLDAAEPGESYHAAVRAGWTIPHAGQEKNLGVCYATTAGIVDLLRRHKWPEDADLRRTGWPA